MHRGFLEEGASAVGMSRERARGPGQLQELQTHHRQGQPGRRRRFCLSVSVKLTSGKSGCWKFSISFSGWLYRQEEAGDQQVCFLCMDVRLGTGQQSTHLHPGRWLSAIQKWVGWPRTSLACLNLQFKDMEVW